MEILINLGYLAAAVLFIFGIKGMTTPKTAVRGNQMSAIGMLVAVIAALLDHNVVRFEYIIIGVLVGGAIGALIAKKVAMTDMPEMVASLNGIGGGASLLVAAANYLESQKLAEMGQFTASYDWSLAVILSILIGAVTLTGSFVAVGKLKGKIGDSNKVMLFKWIVKLCFLVLISGAAYFAIVDPLNSDMLVAGLIIICLILGVSLVMPIGGADMPVVVSLLNSYSGLAGAAAGFVLGNNGLIITGSLVGASGIILTTIMCKAMNRSLTNVLFGGSMAATAGVSKSENDAFYEGKVKFSSADELAMLLDGAQKVVFVPGYGLAVAQAQHATRELANMLEAKGCDVKYAIHPVAGRMPGHMNVLLAEAEVPYDQLVEMDTINPEFSQTDVAIVLGANDVVNPAASKDPASPIFGMPILDVHNAKTVVVVKRGLSPGFAGIPNELFIRDNSLMVSGDAKKVLQETITALKDL
ncbi:MULTISPECIES: NAD(P)(+) transhydrogenase (Re/Si-specific) subunit beta [unclassified Thalassolituus]|jgi:NAD(P) transhydrogenase subunit beta|uniref:NAD(P)(+) transhydrogenase (Re/Si-specific) subunit beta n=1 Tax=Oceanospirillaceae TaxID=135620 RepID=UPI000C55F3D9|nr:MULTISPECIES: NAD(P)(+) transhydrogenase (Re/Si-specific) subunit beta [unclassified Thalassolituus]MCA6058614.1 NAD(P)(+) transhydrogenase (Re/Si-specific) subunit beta [Thalassolituus sp. ST750PaO-4]PIQ41472.1 MAG: NAD synthetase [Thalassolituus sp. CG17_big_fil_post_rev_8_21_14_2_50_53_8]TVV45000.1 NAD(P)(+) transhydrogenase (Re/Si-specific) subunit beta [Thalassolituus sp. C2-1]